MPDLDDLDPYYGEQTARPTPVSTAPTPTSDEPKASKWEGMGVGGGTVRAHWETDEDDTVEAVRVEIAAPPPPPPPARKSNGSAQPAPIPASAAPEEASATPSFDFAEMSRRWPALRGEIWNSPIDRATFHSCELVGVEGAQLVVQMSSGNLRLLKDEKKREIRGKLIELVGRGADIRFIDDKTPYTPPAGAVPAGVTAAAPTPAGPPLPTSDPVIQAGLRFFGGPIERLPDD